jgi:transcriptional regulator with XRE-family HTH domain
MDSGAVMSHQDPADLVVFEEMTKGKVSWDKRAKLITTQFDSVEKLSWKKAFAADIDLFARLVRDILKLEQAQPGRPGPRPALDLHDGVTRLRQYMGEDYAVVPFPEAIREMAGKRSIRSLARKVDLSKNHVHRLLTGEMQPDAYSMAQIAKAFGKHPSFFMEYRNAWIAAAVVSRLEDNPESSISLFRKFKDDL